VPIDLSTDRQNISDQERVKRFADERCLYCGGCNHRAVDCAVRKQAGAFTAAGAEVIESEGKEDPKGNGKEQLE
jgi:hypothetical protein